MSYQYCESISVLTFFSFFVCSDFASLRVLLKTIPSSMSYFNFWSIYCIWIFLIYCCSFGFLPSHAFCALIWVNGGSYQSLPPTFSLNLMISILKEIKLRMFIIYSFRGITCLNSLLICAWFTLLVVPWSFCFPIKKCAFCILIFTFYFCDADNGDWNCCICSILFYFIIQSSLWWFSGSCTWVS